MSPRAAASFGFVVEPSIGVSSKNHVTHAIVYAVIGVGGYVIKELVGYSVGELSDSILLATNITEANKEIFVNCASIVEEGAKNSLGIFDACTVKDMDGFRGGGELRLGPVLDLAILVG